MRLNAHKNAPEDYARARSLRNGASRTERLFWSLLRKNAEACGIKFRRQQAIHPYIADFVCLAARLIVELDGISHDGRMGQDARRDAYLKHLGFKTLRFSNAHIHENGEGVVLFVLDCAKQRIGERKSQSIPLIEVNRQ